MPQRVLGSELLVAAKSALQAVDAKLLRLDLCDQLLGQVAVGARAEHVGHRALYRADDLHGVGGVGYPGSVLLHAALRQGLQLAQAAGGMGDLRGRVEALDCLHGLLGLGHPLFVGEHPANRVVGHGLQAVLAERRHVGEQLRLGCEPCADILCTDHRSRRSDDRGCLGCLLVGGYAQGLSHHRRAHQRLGRILGLGCARRRYSLDLRELQRARTVYVAHRLVSRTGEHGDADPLGHLVEVGDRAAPRFGQRLGA